MRLFDPVQTARAILCRKTPRIDRLADKGPVQITAVGRQLSHGDHLIDDPRQLESGLGAVDLRLEHLAIEVVELLVENSDKPDVLGPRVLQVSEPADHLAAVQTVSATDIRLAGLLRQRLGLALAPAEAQPPGDSDRVDENGVVAIEYCGIAEALAHGGIMRRTIGLLVAKRRVGSADEHREIPAFRPCARPDAVTCPALDGQIARFEIHEQRAVGVERPQKGGFPNSALAEDAALDAARLGQSLIGADDGEAHWSAPCARISTFSVPGRTVRAGSKPARIASGQAAYLRSGTL